MYRVLLLSISVLLSIQLIAQDRYEGQFSKEENHLQQISNIPIGKHVGFDEDEGLTITINYGDLSSINNISVQIASETICQAELNFPADDLEWKEITEGLWINDIGEEEPYAVSYDNSDKIKMHYAGFLVFGDPFDNSFIRNEPLAGKLKYFIPGFSIGAVNVMPNTIRVIKIAPELAYGTKGGGNIPPNATLYYVIYNIENPRA